jgi:hypothetical protein
MPSLFSANVRDILSSEDEGDLPAGTLDLGVDVMKQWTVVTCMIVFAGLAGAVSPDKASPTGTWKWTVGNREATLHLKMEGSKLTGSMAGRNNQETPIEDAKYKDGEISFSITRMRNGQKFTVKYSGKLSGDTITGKMEFQRMGQPESREWEAKRSKD